MFQCKNIYRKLNFGRYCVQSQIRLLLLNTMLVHSCLICASVYKIINIGEKKRGGEATSYPVYSAKGEFLHFVARRNTAVH